MNTPIVNPMWFYIAEVCETIMIISVIVSILCCVVWLFIICDKYDGNNKIDYKKISNKLVLPTIISLNLAIFVPSSKTIYQMIVAQTITPANIQSVEESGQEFVDYIVEKITEIDTNEE